MLEVFVFKIGTNRINLKNLFIKSNHFSIQIFDVKIWQLFFCLHFSLNLHIFSIFKNKNCQIKKN
jgi:hypothetical protein